MRFSRLRLKGIGPFKETAELDLESLPGPIVSFCGPTGAGKSCALEALAGALYRKTPTRGTLAELATTRDAFVQVDCINGQQHRIRQMVDGVSGRGESAVFDEVGAPRLSSSKLSEYDSWARRHLPEPSIFFASTFAAQERPGILSMTDGEIKALILRVAGSEKLEGLAKAARDRASATRTSLTTVEARIDASGGLSVEDAQRALDEAAEHADVTEAEIMRARIKLTEIEAEAERVRAALAQEDDRQRRLAELRAAKDAAWARAQALGARLADVRKVLDRAQEIADAVALAQTVDADLAIERERLAAARAAQQAAAHAVDNAMMAAERAGEAERSIKARIDRATKAMEDREAAAREAERIPEVAAELAKARGDVSTDEGRLEELRSLELSGANARLIGLRAGLLWYRDALHLDYVADSGKLARVALQDDDEDADDIARLPEDQKAARQNLKEGRTRVSDLESVLKTLEQRKAFAETPAPGGDLAAELALAWKQIAATSAEEKRARDEDDQQRRLIVSLVARVNELAEKRRMLQPLVEQAGSLAQAETLVAEIGPQIAAAQADVQTAAGQIALLSAPVVVPTMPPVSAARADVAAQERGAATARADVDTAKQRLTEAQARAEKVAKLEAERQLLSEDLADWTRLGQDLGRDGLQAMLVDDAGQEWMQNANDLLHGCIGPRWTVSLETQRPDADGKKMVEDTQIRVLDTERGRDAEGKTLSGGERALVGEALSLGLVIVSQRDGGMQGATLIRDETSAPLDVASARGYVGMLRRAAQIVNASKVLIASHHQAVQELADCRVEIADGQVRVAP